MIAPPVLLRNLGSVAQNYDTVDRAVSVPIVVQDEPTVTSVIIAASFLVSTGLPLIKLEDPPVPQKITQIPDQNPGAQIFGGMGD
jgi:hypothetical protein